MQICHLLVNVRKGIVNLENREVWVRAWDGGVLRGTLRNGVVGLRQDEGMGKEGKLPGVWRAR